MFTTIPFDQIFQISYFEICFQYIINSRGPQTSFRLKGTPLKKPHPTEAIKKSVKIILLSLMVLSFRDDECVMEYKTNELHTIHQQVKELYQMISLLNKDAGSELISARRITLAGLEKKCSKRSCYQTQREEKAEFERM